MERSCVLNAEIVSAFTADWGSVFHCGTVVTKKEVGSFLAYYLDSSPTDCSSFYQQDYQSKIKSDV